MMFYNRKRRGESIKLHFFRLAIKTLILKITEAKKKKLTLIIIIRSFRSKTTFSLCVCVYQCNFLFQTSFKKNVVDY